jgi:hypothetical protein
MKKIIFIFLFLPIFVFSQEHIDLKNNTLDSIIFLPLGSINIYNLDFKNYIFTNKGVFFDFFEKKKDDDTYNLPATYEEFKRDFMNTNFTVNNKKIINTSLTKEAIANATYSPENNPNVLQLIPYLMPAKLRKEVSNAVMHPISYLYDKFSRKKKMERLYQELVDNEEEVYNLSYKYSKELVASLTGLDLEDEELLDFMTFCKFSYYDLIHWSPEFIILQVKKKYGDYEYYKALEEE